MLKNPTEDLSYEIVYAPTKDFKYEAAKSRLLSLSLDIFRASSGQVVAQEQERTLLLGSLIDLDSREAVSAAGGLLQVKANDLDQLHVRRIVLSSPICAFAQHLESNKMVDELLDRSVSLHMLLAHPLR